VLKKASLLVLPLVVLSACSAGRHNPQFQEVASQDATSATVGGNAVRDAYIVAPTAKGATAHASLFLARIDPGSDALVSATSPVAASIGIVSSGGPVDSVPISGTVATTVSLTLTDVSQAIAASSYYPITLTFATAGEVTLQVPVLRPGIVAPGSTSVPSVLPDVPVGSTVPLQERSVVPNTPHD
jgi:copper(I)-binding protein